MVDGPPVEVPETPPAEAGGADGVEGLVRMVPLCVKRRSSSVRSPGLRAPHLRVGTESVHMRQSWIR
jgi:hypothetical protein